MRSNRVVVCVFRVDTRAISRRRASLTCVASYIRGPAHVLSARAPVRDHVQSKSWRSIIRYLLCLNCRWWSRSGIARSRFALSGILEIRARATWRSRREALGLISYYKLRTNDNYTTCNWLPVRVASISQREIDSISTQLYIGLLCDFNRYADDVRMLWLYILMRQIFPWSFIKKRKNYTYVLCVAPLIFVLMLLITNNRKRLYYCSIAILFFCNI